MSDVHTRSSWSTEQHWQVQNDTDDEGDIIFYTAPPLPSYDAPPPPGIGNVEVKRPSESRIASIPVKQVASLYEHMAPQVDLPSNPAPSNVHVSQLKSNLSIPLYHGSHSSSNTQNSAINPLSGSGNQKLATGQQHSKSPSFSSVDPSSRPLPPGYSKNNTPNAMRPKRPRSGSFPDKGNLPPAPPPKPSGTHPKAPLTKHAATLRLNTPGTHYNHGYTKGGHVRPASVSASVPNLPPFFHPPPRHPAPSTPPVFSKLPALAPKRNLSLPPNAHNSGMRSADSSPRPSPHSPRIPSTAPPPIPTEELKKTTSSTNPDSPPSDDLAASPSATSISAPSRPGLRVDESISDNRVIQEIVITHADYLQDLKLIHTQFEVPMKERNIIAPEYHATLFDGISDLIKVDTKIAESFDIPRKLTPMDIATTFNDLIKEMEVYVPFCARQDQALRIMSEQISNNPSFAQFYEDIRKDPLCRGLSFDAFIIKPLQRLCKLPLLLREVLKGIPEPCEERTQVELAKERLEKLLEEVNIATGATERITELERGLLKKYPQVESLKLTERKFLLDGPIAWVVKQTKDTTKLRVGQFWLFDQLLLFCRSNKELEFIMPLNTVSLSKNLPAVQNFPYVLELMDMTAQGIVTRKLCCEDEHLYEALLSKLT